MPGDSSSKTPQVQTVNQNTSSLPEYAQPFVMSIMQQGQALTDPKSNPYVSYDQQRVANLNQDQTTAGQGIMGEGTTGFAAGKNMVQQAGLGALNTHYDPGQFSNQTIQAPGGVADVNSSQFAVNPDQVAQMQAAQSGYDPRLQTFQMNAPQNFGQEQAQQYMSPYFQQVLDVQKSEALRDAQKSQVLQNLGAARQGTYGGARQLLAQTENSRNLGDQMAKIQASGTQNAYENAQQQFERDRAAGLGVAGQNLQAQLGVQQLGTQTGMQMALANLSNEQQANVQNQAAKLQMQGMNAQQALQAALANQQSGLSTQGMGLQAATSNQSADLQKQQMAEQSRQFGADLGLRGLAQAASSGQALGGLAAQQQATDLARFQAQAAYGTQQQQNEQQHLDQKYQDFLRQQNYPMEQLGYYSNLVHGLPIGVDTTTSMYAPSPSAISQVGGLGLGALGLSQMMKG